MEDFAVLDKVDDCFIGTGCNGSVENFDIATAQDHGTAYNSRKSKCFIKPINAAIVV